MATIRARQDGSAIQAEITRARMEIASCHTTKATKWQGSLISLWTNEIRHGDTEYPKLLHRSSAFGLQNGNLDED